MKARGQVLSIIITSVLIIDKLREVRGHCEGARAIAGGFYENLRAAPARPCFRCWESLPSSNARLSKSAFALAYSGPSVKVSDLAVPRGQGG